MASSFLTRLLFSICFLGTLNFSEAGQLCGSCSHVSDPSNCDHVTRCGDHEECVVTQYLTSGGHVMFDTGCISSFRCSSHPVGKRAIEDEVRLSDRRLDGVLVCQVCCNDTSICNTVKGLCNTQPLDTNGYVLCYKCDQMLSPNQCDKITRCPSHRQCYVEQKVNPLSGTMTWESRCGQGALECMESPSLMTNPGVLVGKRQSPFCAKCCNEKNFCNNECNNSMVAHTFPTIPPSTTPSTTPTPTTSTTTPLPTTTPTTKSTTPSTHNTNLSKPTVHSLATYGEVTLGSSLAIRCTVTGNPTPTIAWGVTHFDPNAPKPNNTQIMDHQQTMYIHHFTAANAGLYLCYATNSQGTDSKVIAVQPANWQQLTAHPTTSTTTAVPTTTNQSSLKPHIIYGTDIHHAHIGANLRLMCVATGQPTPAISWSFSTSSGMPDNLSLFGTELIITGFKQINYGTYRCQAMNIHGTTERFFTISPFP
ncbi:uncharacterized protein [Argopecten irradians]|uniref:uncharacterized protein n=1 Tax=Argopecten irradians TaxID=31199 RepID=UPI00371D888E